MQRKCRECGCTDDRACVTDEGPCHWVEPDLCSVCDDEMKLAASILEHGEVMPHELVRRDPVRG